MRKVFVDRPLPQDWSIEVFAYDYTPSIEKAMLEDECGFYHSLGDPVSLDDRIPKLTHSVQGWDFGDGNTLCGDNKIIECRGFICRKNSVFYVAFTSPYLQDKREVFAVGLYTIPLVAENEARMYDPDVNVFELYEPQKIYISGINGNLSFRESTAGLCLEWLGKQHSADTAMFRYSYDIESQKVTRDSLHVVALPERSLETVIKQNHSENIRYHRVNDSDLYVCVILPDSNVSYPAPAVAICLGGPNIEIPDFGTEGSVYMKMAAAGFFVIVPLRRGVIGINDEWMSALVGNAGIADVNDVISGVLSVLDTYEGIIDRSRIGLYGASYGGYTSLLIAGKRNKDRIFKAVVSHCGMSDLERYPYECYGSPFDIKEFYAGYMSFDVKSKDISPYNFIQNWNAPVLLVHTLHDTSVWFGQSVRAYNKALELQKNVQLLLAPGSHSYDIQNGESLLEQVINFLMANI